MSQIGKDVRLSQIINQESKKQVCIAMDHSPAIGPCEGMIDPMKIMTEICKGKPDTLFTHFGIIKKTLPILASTRTPFLLSISTATTMSPDPSRVILVDSVEHALEIGASGVSMRIFVGAQYEHEMLQNLSKVALECEKTGMPLMAMMYPHGVENILDPKHLKHAARIGAELGADIVKTYYSGDPETFRTVTESCPVPIVMSGGPKADEPIDFLKLVRGAIDGGAIGVAVGRNVWQSREPAKMIRAISLVIHQGMQPQEALEAEFKN
jgi:fructose-bisphosphate aldolase / 2-amino-3,7-dideoxy-D-threo-hept-6-ulosonate synthase